MKELQYYDNGIKRIAKWDHIIQLFKLENSTLFKLSELDHVSVYPRPIERQKVSTCLKVFCEKTYKALLIHPSLCNSEVNDTAIFIKKVITWWKILNVKSLYMDDRFRDPTLGAIYDPNDSRLQTILDFGNMELEMAGKQGHRVKQLSQDTANN